MKLSPEDIGLLIALTIFLYILVGTFTSGNIVSLAYFSIFWATLILAILAVSAIKSRK